MWKKFWSIFIFAYGGTIRNASGLAIDEDINNLFETEQDGWNELDSLTGLNPELIYTVLPVMVFVAK